MGSLLSSSTDSATFSFHHNLYAHNRTRNPKITSGEPDSTIFFDFKNNVIYDWGTKAGYSSEDSAHHIRMNYIGNYLIAGPNSQISSRNEAFKSYTTSTWIYQYGNLIDSDADSSFNGINTGWNMISGTYTKNNEAFNISSVKTESADAALLNVLSSGGAFPWNRDHADQRICDDVYHRTGKIIDSTADIGGYMELPVVRSNNTDSDNDGIPDNWEKDKKLNPEDPSDAFQDSNNDGYTNLEDYINNIPALQTNIKQVSLNLWSDKIVSLWPNPAHHFSTLTYFSNNTNTIEIEILDLKGRCISPSFKKQVCSGLNDILIDLSGINSGNYLLRITNDKSAAFNLIVD